MDIHKVAESDTRRVGEIYHHCALHMNEKGLFNWTEEYPTVKEAVVDQERGVLYGIYEDTILMGVITLDQRPASEYAAVHWEYAMEDSLCIHRIAVDPPFRRKGAASKLLRFAEQYACEQGLRALRIDSFSRNKRAVRLYQRRGFIIRGDIYYLNKDERVRDIPFHCFEKILPNQE